MPYDCRAIANAILDIADGAGLSLSHMAVHKVMYYAHGWHLATTGHPLIRQEFQAWRDGPVQRLVWDCFKNLGTKPIKDRATRLDLVSRNLTEVREPLDDTLMGLLRHIVVGYGQISARELSRMTHARGGPWDQVWNAADGRITLGMRISHESIRADFQKSAPLGLAS